MKPSDSDSISRLFKKHHTELKHQLPLGLKSKILQNLFANSQERASLLSWMSFGGGVLAMGVALIVTFQLGRLSVSGTGNPSLAEEVVSSHVRSLMVNEHLSDVISTDRHTVKPWFEGKIDFGPNVQDFAKDGFPLIGGRLEYVNGRPTAALVYKSSQHIINVFQYPSNSASARPRLQTIRGYQIFTWSKEGMNYWAVSDVNAADLQRFVELW